MADEAISSMYVLLGLNTVDFEKGAADASKIAKKTSDEIDESFGNLTEGRGGIALASEAIGIHLPRHLQTLLAKIPGVGAAFSAMLPIAGAVVAFEIVGKLIAKHDELAAAIMKAAIEAQALAIREGDVTKSMELANLRMADQIAKLQSGVSNNGLKEALIETSLAADHLAASFNADFEKIDKSIADTTGIMGTFMQVANTAGRLLASWHPADEWHKSAGAIAKVRDALDGVTSQQERINALITASSKGGSEDQQIQNAKNLGLAYDDMGKKLIAAMRVVAVNAPQNTELVKQMAAEVVAMNEKVKQQAELAIEIGQRVTEAEQKNANDGAEARDKAFRQQAEAMKRETEWEDSLRKEAYEKAVAGLEESEKEQITATAQGSQARIDVIVAALVAEQSKGLQDTSFYKSLLIQKIEATKSYAQTIQTIGDESLKFEEELSKLRYESDLAGTANALKMGQESLNQDVANRKAAEERRYTDLKNSISNEMALSAAAGTLTEVQQKQMNDKLAIEEQKHVAQMAAIDRKAEQEKVLMYQAAEDKLGNAIAKTAAKSIVESKNMGDAFHALGKQMAEAALTSLLELETVEGRKKLVKAKSAASGAYTGVMDMDLPPIIAFPLAIASGAAAFAGVMAFEQGGIVPSTQMAMVHQHEMILPSHISQGLQGMIANNRGAKGNPSVVMNISTPNADSFRASRHQIDSDMHHSITTAARRNG